MLRGFLSTDSGEVLSGGPQRVLHQHLESSRFPRIQTFLGLPLDVPGIRDRRWNSERFIVFQTVTLQRARHVTASRDIQRQIEKLLDAWEAGIFKMLVEDTLRSSTQYLTYLHRS